MHLVETGVSQKGSLVSYRAPARGAPRTVENSLSIEVPRRGILRTSPF